MYNFDYNKGILDKRVKNSDKISKYFFLNLSNQKDKKLCKNEK